MKVDPLSIVLGIILGILFTLVAPSRTDVDAKFEYCMELYEKEKSKTEAKYICRRLILKGDD
ncbi:hypothetical protein [Microbulbifer magnicolonia]|uniref:hypothetical protein n=1 Tax=Microbulbifer magnicolonia TaxID=3109744 RepID=UPI002B410374|nr:hypothetical protein [Microbulbifer sp. GG15]